MSSLLPPLFIGLAALGLLLVLHNLWRSLRLVLAVRGRGSHEGVPRSAEREALLVEKQELLTAIREARFEHELGKVSDADHARMDQRYRARAREVLQALDAQLEPYRARAEAMLESQVRDASVEERAPRSAPPPAASPDAAPSSAPPICPACGTANEADANFCKKCAARLGGEA